MHMLNVPTATHCQVALKIAMIVIYFSQLEFWFG